MKSKIFRITFSFLLFSTSLSGLAQDLTISSSRDGEKFTYRNSNPLQSFDVESKGKIELTDDDKDIRSISSDGYLEIEKTVFGSRRKIVITPQANGLKREYYEGRSLVAFEPKGRNWLSEILPELVRTTTIGAESRVNRFFRKGGTNGVLTEISKMESDYVVAHYAKLLMTLPVTVKEYPLIISKVVLSIGSDHYRTEFLESNMDKFVPHKEALDAVCEASTHMESDHYKTQVIQKALSNQTISGEAVKSVLVTASLMSSDHYITEVLTTLLKQRVTDAIVSEIVSTTKSIESDHYRSVVLRTALSKIGLSATSYQYVLESVKDMESDHYKAEVLTTLTRHKMADAQIFNLVALSGSINSDHYLTEVYTSVLKTQQLSDESFKKLIEFASRLDSDHYASSILQSALSLPELNDAKVASILVAAGNMDSDHYLTEVLIDAAPTVRAGSASLKDAYRTAARKISSETYYGRALRAVE